MLRLFPFSFVATLAKLAAIPLMKAITSSLNRDLLLEKEKDTYYFAFDTKELLKGDMKSRFDAYKVALDANFMQIDEVRYMEDLEELGFNWIRMVLQDVLYNPQTGDIFTMNTGKMENLQGVSLKHMEENGKTESRANPNHDPKTGRFTSDSGSSKNKKQNMRSKKTGKENKGEKLDATKYSVVTGAFATNYPNITSGQKTFRYGDYKYTMRVNDFGDYIVQKRSKITSRNKRNSIKKGED